MTWRIFLKTIISLARNIPDKICANLVNFLKEFISSHEFLEQRRQNQTDFSWNRKLPFVSLIPYLCNPGGWGDITEKLLLTNVIAAQ